MASQKQRQRHDTANKQADNGVLQWRQTGASYQGLMTLIGQQTAPRLDSGLDDGGGARGCLGAPVLVVSGIEVSCVGGAGVSGSSTGRYTREQL